jgi:hypothetical protein
VTLLLYGIVRADHPLPPGLRAVAMDDLAVVVADVTAELDADQARSHLDVLCGLIADGPVLPLRFGSTAPDENAVVDNALRPDPEALRHELDRISGMVEVRVHLTFDEPSVLDSLLAEDPALAAPTTGFDATMERGRHIAERVRAWVTRRSDDLLAGLAEEIVRLPESDEQTQRWALLVRADDLDRVAEAISAMPGTVTASALGPLPPYSFVSLPAKPVSRWGFG